MPNMSRFDVKQASGLAGQPEFSMLIGMDKRAACDSALKVLNHHEPGCSCMLEKEPLFDFVNQYKGQPLFWDTNHYKHIQYRPAALCDQSP